MTNTDVARTRRLDPERRERIIAAALDLIAKEGVAGISHRKVAAAADVPLGSMTYHFAGIDELIHEAFTRFATSVSDQIEQRMDGTADRSEALEALIAHIDDDLFGNKRDLVLTMELYALAARDERFRVLTSDWMKRSRAALEQHIDARTARALDALVEGLTIHRALDLGPAPSGLTRMAIERVAGNAERD